MFKRSSIVKYHFGDYPVSVFTNLIINLTTKNRLRSLCIHKVLLGKLFIPLSSISMRKAVSVFTGTTRFYSNKVKSGRMENSELSRLYPAAIESSGWIRKS